MPNSRQRPLALPACEDGDPEEPFSPLVERHAVCKFANSSSSCGVRTTHSPAALTATNAPGGVTTFVTKRAAALCGSVHSAHDDAHSNWSHGASTAFLVEEVDLSMIEVDL
jgi:hypothetical protein